MNQFRLAFRTLFKSPFVTAVAILSLSLGIGANAAIFSLLDQMLLRPLPVRAPGELVNLSAPGPSLGNKGCAQAGYCEDVFSYPMFRDLERSQSVLTGLAGHLAMTVSLTYDQQPMNGQGMLVSGSYFPTLGLTPALGRLLGPADDDPIGANFVTVLSYGFWRSRFGGDPSVLGKLLAVNGREMTIVGVAPRGFEGTTLGVQPLTFLPISMYHELTPTFTAFNDRRNYWVYLFGRAKHDLTLAQVAAGLNEVYQPIIRDVEAPLQPPMSGQTMEKFRAKEITVSAGARGQSTVHTDARTPMFLLFAIAGTVLLIACANIANLLLARGANRAMEMGVRLALGATRRQLVTQLLTESVLLAGMGAVASLVVAQWTLRTIGTLLPGDALPTLSLGIDTPIVAFAGALAVATGALFGLFPALHCTRGDLVTTIRAGAGNLSGARAAARFRSSLVTAQIALSMALLIAAGLFMKSLAKIGRVDLGMQVDHVVTFGLSAQRAGYDSARAQDFYARAERALAAVPGVTGVTSSIVAMLTGDSWDTRIRVQGYPEGLDADDQARYNAVGAGYFGKLGITLRAGREFTDGDVQSGALVVVVNEAFARKFGLGADPIGKYMAIGRRTPLNMQIVGLVSDAKYATVKDTVPPVFYMPWRQRGGATFMNYYVRGSLPASQLLKEVPAAMKRFDSSVPVEGLKSMPQQIKDNVFLDRLISMLSAAFAVLATLLAAVGLYGVLAYTVAQRTREIGVRMALGADAGQVQVMVMRQVGWMILVGGAAGVAGAFAMGRVAASQLYEVNSFDPVVFALAIIALLLVAAAAGWLPARKASRIDPIKALRYD